MTTSAYQKYLRMSPRKLRLVADLVRNMNVDKALTTLAFTRKRAAGVLRQVVVAAKMNALKKQATDATIRIKEILIEEGPSLKRFRPVSRGRAHSILKRMSHIKVTVEHSKEAVPGVK
jgi:large subunit ribosomal protein L22